MATGLVSAGTAVRTACPAVRTVADARVDPVAVTALTVATATGPPDGPVGAPAVPRNAAGLAAPPRVSHATKPIWPVAATLVPVRPAAAARATASERVSTAKEVLALKDAPD